MIKYTLIATISLRVIVSANHAGVVVKYQQKQEQQELMVGMMGGGSCNNLG